MTPRIVAGIAFKVFAMWLLVKTIMAIPVIWVICLGLSDFRSPEEVSIFLPVIIFIFLLAASCLVAIVVWRLETKAINEVPDVHVQSGSTGIAAVFLQILGLYFIVTSVTEIPYHVQQYITSLGDKKMGHGLWILGETLKMIVGLLLLANASAWLSVLQKLRELGERPHNNSLNADGSN